MIKAIFVDRDGTINVEKEYLFKPDDFSLIDGSLEALSLLTKMGIKIYIVTNQAGIARGYYTEEDFHKLTDYMLAVFADHSIKVEEVLYCPHHPDGKVEKYSFKCSCRKPDVGMFEPVISKNNYLPEEMVLIGDKNSDIEAGKRLGIKTLLVETGYGGETKKSGTDADFIVSDLLAGVKHLFELEGN